VSAVKASSREKQMARLEGMSDEALTELAEQAFDAGDDILSGDISVVLNERGIMVCIFRQPTGEADYEADL
jgi:hypothetical protein